MPVNVSVDNNQVFVQDDNNLISINDTNNLISVVQDANSIVSVANPDNFNLTVQNESTVVTVTQDIMNLVVNEDTNLPNHVDITIPTTQIVEIITPGPQGPPGIPGTGYIDTSSFITTSSFNFYTGSSTSQFAGTASFASRSLSASYATTASYVRNAVSASFATTARNILGGKATHIPYFITDTTLATSSIYQSGSYSIIINQDGNTPENPEALYVWQPHPTSFNIISGKANLNNYAQLNVFNTNTGDNASSDIVATADNGSETTNFIDMGINGSGFIGEIGNANDAYLYSAGQHLHIGNTNPTKPIQFFVGGADSDLYRKLELNADGQHNITGSLEISGSLKVNQGITGSLFGTSSYAATASIGPGTVNYLPKFTSTTTIGNSLLQDNGTNIITNNTNFLVGSNWKIFYDAFNSIQHKTGNGWNITSWLDTRFFIGGESNEIMRLTNAGLGITGSLSVSRGITGSLLGTASYVSGSVFTGANPALTSSYALTASYALNAGGGGSPFPYTGSALITGSLGVTGSVSISGSSTASGSILRVVGSGSNQPIFTVQGSQGELFSVTDSLSGSLFSVNDISGLPILEVFSDNTTLVGNYQAPALITTTKRLLTNSGSFLIYAVPTASYDGAFFEYTLRSGSNARAGQIMAMWSGSSVNYTEMTTTNFGTTSGVTFGVFISGSNMVLTGSASSSAWTIKTIVRSI